MNGGDHTPPVHARRVVSRNSFVRYVEEDITPKPGEQQYTYYFLETTQPAVIVVPVLPDGHLLLERVYRHPHRQWFVEFPAGGIDAGETPEQAAARELLEETGFVAKRLTRLGRVTPLAGLVQLEVTVVLAEGLMRQQAVAHEPMELLEECILSQQEAEAVCLTEAASGILIFGLQYLRLWQARSNDPADAS